MDTYFISHGAPTLVIDESFPARAFLQSWQSNVLQDPPKAILLVSAHWDTCAPTVNIVNGINDTIYDFYGFPKSMYKLKYPAPGAPELAKKVKELLHQAGFSKVKEDKKRGLDHGAWVPLMLMYPEANIPVCQLSIQSGKDATHHYNLGKALAPLRDEGVLIVGSGSTTHNLRLVNISGGPPAQWTIDFDNWLTDSLVNGRHDDVNNFLKKTPLGKVAHPSPDHFYPLHVALGAAGAEAKGEVIHHSITHATICYTSYRFKPSA